MLHNNADKPRLASCPPHSRYLKTIGTLFPPFVRLLIWLSLATLAGLLFLALQMDYFDVTDHIILEAEPLPAVLADKGFPLVVSSILMPLEMA